MSQFVEIAVGLPRHRGRLIPKATLSTYLDGETPIYRSLYLYDEQAVDYQKTNGRKTIANYIGTRYIGNLIIDVDKETNTDDYTLQKLIGLIHDLTDLGVPETAMQPFFSGSGYHLLLHENLFNFKPSPELPYIVKETMKGLLEGIDVSIYMRSGIYRLAHTKNLKTGLYKIPITFKEVFNLNAHDIRDLATTPRFDFPYKDYPLEADGELEEYVKDNVEPVRSYNTVNEPINIATCIHTIFKDGPKEGTRHNAILRLASHFKRHGIPSDATKASILHWNNNQLQEQEVLSKVENVYNAGYKYGCNDSILKDNCHTRCIYYKRKDYLVDVHTSTDLQKSLENRLSGNFDGRIIDLGKLFGLAPELDAEIYPAELLTIFGPSGSSKSTLAQNIALGYSAAQDELMPDYQMPTLYLSLELSGWYSHRRNIQIAADVDKVEASARYKELYKEHKKSLDHIMVQTVAPTIPQIKEKIQELQPSLVIVDYIDQIETPYKDEYSQVKYVSHQLRTMATNLDIIIIQISQVSRQYSREEILDLYAGKGSGAIENASSKVLGIHGNAKSIEKKLELFKNTDGDLFTVDLEWTPSFRLKRAVT